MSTVYKQEDFYDPDTIKERLTEKLGSDEWENIKTTDLGQNLLEVGSEIVHEDAMAFFTGMNQMFKSKVSQAGYLEEIAKSNGVIPKTYVSASITISIYSKSSAKSYTPMNFSLQVGGKTFYNIEDITIGTIASPTTLVLYEGGAIRSASEAGTLQGSSWSYTQLKAVQSEKIGDKVVRKYLLLPRNTFIDSIVVESGSSWEVPFVRWTQVDTWYGVSATSRSWKLGKDVLGRYRVEFGDGTYGRVYPTSDILGIRYISSGGSGISIDNLTDYILYSQDINDITSDFVVGSISDVVDGQSEVNLTNLSLEIEAAQNTRDAIISEDDHKTYLESRSDVLFANITAERHADPPNIEYYNTVTYAIKPLTDGGSYNDADIQNHLGKYGIDTVEYKNVSLAREKFNIEVSFAVLAGYTDSSVQSEIETLLETAFSWDTLDFNETISEERVFSEIKDIEGLDTTGTEISVIFVHTNEDTGATEFTYTSGDAVSFKFYPRRFKVNFESDALVVGTVAQDNGFGTVYGDVLDAERFPYTADTIASNTYQFGNMLIMGIFGDNERFLIDLRKDDGAVSKLIFPNDFKVSCWCDRYNEIITVEEVGADHYLRAYSFPESFFDPTGFNYIQLTAEYTYTAPAKEWLLDVPVSITDALCMVFYDSYLYVAVLRPNEDCWLVRHRIMSESIEGRDLDYNGGTGYLVLSAKSCRSMAVIEDIFGDGRNALLISADSDGTTESGLDLILDFDNMDDCVYEADFFNAAFSAYTKPFDLWGVSSDGDSLYAVLSASETGNVTVLVKLYAFNSDGTLSIKILSDTSTDGMRSAAYSLYNSVGEVYAYSVSTYRLYKVGFDDSGTAPVLRAGSSSGDVTSITAIGAIDYAMQKIIFSMDITGELRYQAETDLIFEDEEMPILKELNVYQE